MHPLFLALTIPDWLPWALMVGGGLVVIAVLVWAVSVKRRAGAEDVDRFRDEPQSTRSGSLSPRSAQSHTAAPDPSAELLQIVQTMTGKLDRKIDRLERLIASADERISALQRASESPRSAVSSSHAASSHHSSSGRHAASDDHLSGEVVRLAEQGFTPLQIAQKLGQGVGMVELVLALRR